MPKANAGPGALDSATWSDRYLLHKYWARKPANVVRQYIEHFTQDLPDAVVLDPFCGSGVTAVEALALGKQAIAVDVNPVACHLTRVTAVSPVDLGALDACYERIMADVQAELGWLYTAGCPDCGHPATVRSIGWTKDEPTEVRYACPQCGGRVRSRPFAAADAATVAKAAETEIPYWYPDIPVFDGWETLKLKRAGLRSFTELYTRRNLLALAALWDRIIRVSDTTTREILQVTFTAMVAQGTKMIADFKDKAGGPSWKINTYWLPARWQELNVFHYFANRYERMRKAKLETNQYVGAHPRLTVACASATALTPDVVAPESVDYVFTDPPYGGESIQYLELSALWNMWLTGGQVDLTDEVIFNPHRKLDQAYYNQMLARSFAQIYRALKPGRCLSVTFHNKDSAVWNALLGACTDAGFLLETIVPLNASAPNLTQRLTKGAPKTDLVLNFRKPRRGDVKQFTLDFREFGELDAVVCAIARGQIAEFGHTTTAKVFDQAIIRWFTTYFGGVGGAEAPELSFTIFDVERILARHFEPGAHLVENDLVRQRGDAHWVARPEA